MYSENTLRQLPCYHCTHCIGSKDMKRNVFTKRLCDLTNRWGSMNKAFYCTKFENVLTESSDYEVNGYRIKKDQIEDYRTENQWVMAGYQVRTGCKGTKMYATRMAAMNNEPLYVYYLPKEVKKR